MANTNPATITFKAEASLVEALQAMPNRSAFIRSAILTALNNTCPVCQGTGILTPHQKVHWDEFAENHALTECGECREWHLVCRLGSQGRLHER